MKSRSGFTIVELVVVVAVIVILSGLSIAAYRQIQMEARDAKRKADITTLVGLFEKYYDKNGAYPGGCSRYPSAQLSSCIHPSAAFNNTDNYTSDTSVSTIRSQFPELSNSFGDPDGSAGYPFSNDGYPYGSDDRNHYFYMGQADSAITGSYGHGFIDVNSSSEVYCGGGSPIGFKVPAGALPKIQTFALGYWSEVDEKWYIYQGKHGYELTRDMNATNAKVRGTSVGTQCVFVQ